MKKARQSPDEAKRALHAATYRLKEFKADCGLDINQDIRHRPPSPVEFWLLVFGTVCVEFAAVFYFLLASLGLGDSLYTAVMTITLIVITAGGAALGHALAARPPVSFFHWRRLVGATLLMMCSVFFMAALGLLSHTRADSTASGFQAVIAGYRAMYNLEVLVSGVVNVACFAALVYEFRKFIWPKYWGFDEAKKAHGEAVADCERIGNTGSY